MTNTTSSDTGADRELVLSRLLDAPRDKVYREQHEKMGFHEGWGQCADQLEEVARSI